MYSGIGYWTYRFAVVKYSSVSEQPYLKKIIGQKLVVTPYYVRLG
jgi:hypothetical protein